MRHGVALGSSPPPGGERSLRAHRLVRLLAVAIGLGALGSTSFQGVTFTEQLLRLAVGVLG